MNTNHLEWRFRKTQISRVVCVICGSLLFTVFGILTPVLRSFAECTFSSGSTGTNGVFNPTNSMPSTGWSISNNVVTVTNSADGVFHFTSIYIETNWVVTFTKNALNTPVYLLATNDVTIKGTIDLRGGDQPATATMGGLGAAGGFDGGSTFDALPGGNGFGPGGGTSGGSGGFGAPGTDSGGGPAYGTLDILPMIGGSGGAGRGCCANPGCGGGGALLIGSSTLIDISGTITVNGGNILYSSGAGAGSGGGIRLIAPILQGEGAISASGGSGDSGSAIGRIRLEACNNKRVSLSAPPATFGPPGLVFLTTNPTIRVTSIAGTNTPAIPAGSLTVPDVYLPTNNPAVISVSASNVNPGTTFKVIIVPAYGTNMIATNSLVGTYAFSTNSVTMQIYTDRVWRVNALIDYIPRP